MNSTKNRTLIIQSSVRVLLKNSTDCTHYDFLSFSMVTTASQLMEHPWQEALARP